MSDRLFIFDTTLRDGEQVPGCQLNTVEKIQVAKALETLGVATMFGVPRSFRFVSNSIPDFSLRRNPNCVENPYGFSGGNRL